MAYANQLRGELFVPSGTRWNSYFRKNFSEPIGRLLIIAARIGGEPGSESLRNFAALRPGSSTVLLAVEQAAFVPQ
jgi:hypothetical protein